MDHSSKAETTFGDLEVDERFQKLKRSLKLAMLKTNRRKMSEEETDTRMSLPGLSSIDGDAFNSSCTTWCPPSLKSDVLASSNNLKNLLLKKPSFYNTNQKQIVTSSVKQYDVKHKNDIDRLIMPPPETPVVCHGSKKPMNTLSNCENTAPVILDSSVQSSAANTFPSKSTFTGMSSGTNSDKEHLNTDRVFSNWKVMLDKQLELRIKGTLKCGSRVYSKPIIRRYNTKCVESKFKYKYHLEGNIVDERNDLPDYIRGKFYNGFPDDWENVYQVWRMYFTQGCPVTFHWPTPITDSDDDLISEVTDFAYACKNKNKVVSTAERYKSAECTRILEKSINKSPEEKKQYHNHSDHYQQSNRNTSVVSKPISEFKEKEVSVAQTNLVDIGSDNQLNPNFSSEFVIRKIRYLKNFLQEDQMNIIINNLEHKNCSPVYVNKVLEVLDNLDFITTYRTKSNCDENSVVSASCDTSKSEVILQQSLMRNDNRANIDKCENKLTEQKNCRYSNDYENQIIHTSNYSSNEPEYDNNDNSDQSESMYLGVPKVSFEQVLKTKESLGKTYKRRERKRKVYTDLQKNAANAQSDTENLRWRSVRTLFNNSKQDLVSESCVSVTEDEIEVIDMRRDHETELVHKQQETRQKQTIFSNRQENVGKNVIDTYRKNKPEKHTEDVQCYNPFQVRRSNEFIFVQEEPKSSHKVKKNAQFIPDIDYQTDKSDLDAVNVDTYMKKPIRSATLVSRVSSDQESVNTENKNNLLKSSRFSRKSHTELAVETNDETVAKKLKPTIISSVPVNLNLKICNTSSKSDHNSDVSMFVDDRDKQCANIRSTETSPKKISIPPTVSTNNIRSKTTNDGRKEIRSITSDKKETSTNSTKSVTNQDGYSTNKKKETNGINSISSMRSIKNQNEISKNVETGPRNTKKLTAWLPKVICHPQSKHELGLIFEGKLLNEADHVVHRKFSTGVVLKRLSAKLIETVDHQFYELYGSFNDSKHNFPKELARLCRNGCPNKIEEFCLTWKMLLNDNMQKVTTETFHETSVDLLNTAVSSRGRKLLPPLSYWTGERISLKDNNLVYNPGNSNDSLVSLSERSKTASSIEEKEKSRAELKKPTKKQDVNRQQVSPKSNTVSDIKKDPTVISGKPQSSGKTNTSSTTSKRKNNTRRSAINGKQRIMRQLTYSISTSSEEEQESPLKRARSSRSGINANALSRVQTSIKTRQNKQTSSSSTVR
ncbi:uncharacterized protein LOC109859499 isoform X2 [Pseudomyrmex gracilis]|nr:uncharacterized protein LOC109859499 isoform X2 [Pseudomyrmex gracilis]